MESVTGALNVEKNYRPGAIGALMDEYERAGAEFARVVGSLTEEEFVRVADSETKDEDCRSIQTIAGHVVRAGYGYADLIRDLFQMPRARPDRRLPLHQEVSADLDEMLRYTVATLEGKWQMPDEEIFGAAIRPSWGSVCDLEQLLEHAIVHVLRHRRQTERLLQKMRRETGPGI
jgi:uncharacterized damage-inducible protein DinB